MSAGGAASVGRSAGGTAQVFISALRVSVSRQQQKEIEVVNFRVFHLRETLLFHLILLHLQFRLGLRLQLCL